MASVTFDPQVPLGSESLKTGPSRIKAIAAGVLQLFGFSGVTLQSFTAPFTSVDVNGLLTVTGDPVSPLGIATAEYAQRKGIFATVTSADGISYTGATPSTPIDAYDESALYIIENASMVSGPNAITLQLGTAPVAPVNRSDGSSLSQAGEFGLGFFLLMFDSANFRIVNFIGGIVPNPITLPGSPATDLQAADKLYVDQTVGAPSETVQADNVTIAVANTEQTIITVPPIVIPNDSDYVLHAAYFLYMVSGGGSDVVVWDEAAWITDGAVKWAGAASFKAQASGWFVARGSLGGSGFAPTVYPAGSTVNLTVEAFSGRAGVIFGVAPPIGPGPPASVIVTLMRHHA